MIAWLEPAFQSSPPFGDETATVGAVRSPAGAARRVAHSVAFMNSTLSATSAQPSKMFVLPGFAEPSSIGELSPQKNTRPLP